MSSLPTLPVDALLPRIAAALHERPALVLRSPTGSGKTSRVPPFLDEAGFGPVLLAEPRRVAARAAARRMCAERGEPLGGRFGYRVRFDARVSAATRVTALTEGLLLRQLLADPWLEGVGCVVFDEFHERHLEGDLALALLRRTRRELREDLCIVVLSATLDPGPVAAFLDAEVIESEGRLHPIEVLHRPPTGGRPLEAAVAEATEEALQRTAGDVLVFLPGKGEIRRAEQALRGRRPSAGLELVPLHGDLDGELQDAALRRGARRKVVLATNVAESSVTVQGVGAVVDSGWARVPRFDPRVGLDRLERVRIPLASVRQRAGRAGREGPGCNLRLWSALEERGFAEELEPEVRRVDVAGAWLALHELGEGDPRRFAWFEAPPAEAALRAEDLLLRLGAVEGPAGTRRITPLGRDLVRLPLAPRLGRLLLAGRRHGCTRRAALAAALLSERDVCGPALETLDPAREHDSDVLERVQVLEDHEAGRLGRLLRAGPARRVLRVRDQLRGLLAAGPEAEARADDDEALLRAVFDAFADRLARRRDDPGRGAGRAPKARRRRGRAAAPGAPRALTLEGKGVQLAEDCRVRGARLLVCVDVDAGGADARVRQASRVDPEWLDPAGHEVRWACSFDPEREEVRLVREASWNGLVLHRSPQGLDAGGEALDGATRARVEATLVAAAGAAPERAFALEAPELLALHGRLACFADWHPERALRVPEPPEWVRERLEDLVRGRACFAELRALDLAAHWLRELDPALRAELAREAPERFAFPDGSSAQILYRPGQPPLLAARIQQFFGLDRPLRVAGGRVPLLLHLCAPNGRPAQVTDDLPGFWRGSYALVRRELRGRYPRHDWPEDPLAVEVRPRGDARPGRADGSGRGRP